MEIRMIPSTVGRDGRYYGADRDGRIYTMTSRQGLPLVNPQPMKMGCSIGDGATLSLAITVDGKRYNRRVRDMVAEAFLGPKAEGMRVAHLDSDKMNCRVANLEYRPLGRIAKLTEDQALEIYQRSEDSIRSLAMEFDVNMHTILDIRTGRTWSSVTGQAKLPERDAAKESRRKSRGARKARSRARLAERDN